MRVFVKAFLHETYNGEFEILESEIMCEQSGEFDIKELFDIDYMLPQFIDDLEEDEYCEVFCEIELDYSKDYYGDIGESHNCLAMNKHIITESNASNMFGFQIEE